MQDREDFFGNKNNPFEVPEGYFDDFEAKFMNQISEVETVRKKSRLKPFVDVVKPWVAMAAAFIVIAVIYYQAPRLFENDQEQVDASVFEEEEFINSVALMVDENDIQELIINEDSTLVIPSDTLYWSGLTEEELATLTYFE